MDELRTLKAKKRKQFRREEEASVKQPAKGLQLGFPDLNGAGKIQKTCANARHALKLVGIACKYDAFHDKLIIGGHAIGEYVGELSDNACLVLRRMFEDQYEFDPGREHMFDAAVQLCLENRHDPIVDYLDALEWDDVERVDKWLTTYLGASDTDLNSAIGRIALVAMVRRARQPGVKFDQIIVMEGREGLMKSTALQVLAGAPENFSDQTILGLSDKEQQELLRGRWIYEIADLSNIRRAEVEHVKAFASRTHDRSRPAYGRAVIDVPRRCVVWATTNNTEYLKSQTGNRRFWPFSVGTINIEALARDRDQLLAEAASLDDAKLSLVLPHNLWGAAAQEQELRREADPWEDILRKETGVRIEGEDRVLTQYLLDIVLVIPKERQTPTVLHRIGECMRVLSWRGPKVMRVGESRGRGYWRHCHGGHAEHTVTQTVPNDSPKILEEAFHRNNRDSIDIAANCHRDSHCDSIVTTVTNSAAAIEFPILDDDQPALGPPGDSLDDFIS